MTTSRFPKLPPERPGHPASPELQARRESLAAAIDAGKYRTSPLPIESVLNGVRLLHFATKHDSRTAVIHFHGGAFRLGNPEMIGPFAAALSARCNVEVICPDYRLAPEYPLPAALHDGVKTIDALLNTGYTNLIISGDSAGGGLATSLIALCIAAGIHVTGLVLMSPWLDLTLTSDCYATNAATDLLFSHQAAADAAQLYLQGVSAENPLASPLSGSVAGFPPTLISVGSGEVLASDGERFHLKLQRAGVTSHFIAIAGMEHVAVTRGMQLPGAAETFDVITKFIDASLERSSAR